MLPTASSASPVPIANVGTVLHQAQAMPSQTVDELAAMVDVSTQPSDAACTAAMLTAKFNSGGESRCVSVKLRVWERVRAQAVVSNKWPWMSEAALANMDLYKWGEVVAEAPDGLVLKAGGCYYMTASVYDRGANGSAEIAVENLRSVKVPNRCRHCSHPRHPLWQLYQ